MIEEVNTHIQERPATIKMWSELALHLEWVMLTTFSNLIDLADLLFIDYHAGL